MTKISPLTSYEMCFKIHVFCGDNKQTDMGRVYWQISKGLIYASEDMFCFIPHRHILNFTVISEKQMQMVHAI